MPSKSALSTIDTRYFFFKIEKFIKIEGKHTNLPKVTK